MFHGMDRLVAWTRRSFSLALLITLGSSTALFGQDSSTAQQLQVFRKGFPFHIQTLALSRALTDGSRVLVISEPPPHVTLDELRRRSPVLSGAKAVEHPVGHDGWVKDIVVHLPSMERSQLQSLLLDLNQYLFFTTYKPSVLQIGTNPSPNRARLDISLSAADLAAYASGRTATFIPLAGGETSTLAQLLTRRGAGVFFSQNPGLVAWIFPREGDLSHYKAHARQFAVDSDLILGVMANKNGVAILGRERVTPVDVVPPLRTETILQLASVGKDELSQSYERTDFAAGKFGVDTDADWAPIFLSDELIDTEYGSLLNITDQLLKGWSMNGQVTYENFPYPSPAPHWPFTQPLPELLSIDQLTFNWNTKGAGYATEGVAFSAVVPARTGALPISYLSEGEHASDKDSDLLDAAETKAYKYYSGLNDPNLVRVVEYATLYQAFRYFNIRSTADPFPVTHLRTENFRSEVRRVLDALLNLTEKSLAENLEKLEKEGVTGSEAGRAEMDLDHVPELVKMLKSVKSQLGDDGIWQITDHVVSPRAHTKELINVYGKVKAHLQGRPLAEQKAALKDLRSPSAAVRNISAVDGPYSQLSSQERRELAVTLVAREISAHRSVIRVLTGTSVASLKTAYEHAVQRPDNGWIKTPAIVVSTPDAKIAYITGGHNLDARVPVFRQSAELSPKSFKVIDEPSGKRVILYSQEDAPRIQKISEQVGRHGAGLSAGELQELLNEWAPSIPLPAPVERNVRLGFTLAAKPSPGRGMQAAHSSGELPPFGFRTSARVLTPAQSRFAAALSAADVRGTVVEKMGSDSIMIYHGATNQVVEATSQSSVIEVLTEIASSDADAGRTTRIVFRNFPEKDAANTINSARVKTADIKNARIEGAVEIDNMAVEDIARFANEKSLDLSTAKVTQGEVVHVTDEVDLHSYSLEINNKVRARPSFLIRIQLFLKRGVTRVFETVQTRISETLGRLSGRGEPPSAWTVASELNADLKATFGVDAVRSSLVKQEKDFVISEERGGIPREERPS